jgi:hypothetical protein
LPVAVDCTAQLREIQLAERSMMPPSEMQLRLMYSMSLLRMVNGVCDPSQKRKFAGSVMTLARRLGLPSMLVDLRHAATHKSLPAMPALQQAAEAAVLWLHTRYWAEQQASIDELAERQKPERSRRRAGRELRKYCRVRAAAMQRQLDVQGEGGGGVMELRRSSSSSSSSTSSTHGSLEPEAKRLQGSVGDDATLSLETLVEVLLDDGILLPKKQSGSGGGGGGGADAGDDGGDDGGGDDELDGDRHTAGEMDGVFARLQCVWQPALLAVALRRPKLRDSLVEAAVSRLVAEGDGGACVRACVRVPSCSAPISPARVWARHPRGAACTARQ